MGNLFLSSQLGQYIKLSNGGTAVLIDVLMLSLSDLATTLWEKRFTQWLGEHDQPIWGIGTVGFELDEIGWWADEFEPQKQFVLKAVDMAANKHRWSYLDYEPTRVLEYVLAFGLMIRFFEVSSIKPENAWRLANEIQFELCPQHRVYMHMGGCVICNWPK